MHTTTHDGHPITCILIGSFGGREQIDSDGTIKLEKVLRIRTDGHWKKEFIGLSLAARRLANNDEDSDLFLGRRVRQGEINFKTIEMWLRGCERWHITADEYRGCGHRKWESDVSKPDVLRVIDVNHHCIIDAPKNCRYLALSYVWGSVNTLQASTANIEFLSKPNGLLDAANVSPIAQTILDAIVLTRNIHENFLWVDSLCILQDDAQEKHNQISSMDRVYCAAVCTIIAAGGNDANAGLSGVRPSSRFVKQIIKEISPDISLVVPMSTQGFSLSSSIWNTRGWTYQERLLSKRFIIFTPASVYWQCRTVLWYEDIILEAEGVIDSEMLSVEERLRFLNVDSNWHLNQPVNSENDVSQIRLQSPPSLDQYKWTIGEYTRRKLSYPGDILNAFGGIQKVISVALKSDFLFGLPSTYLDVVLLWKPSKPLQRRVDNAYMGSSTGVFPSWSWACWVGEVGFSIVYPENGRLSGEEHSRPLLHWYIWSIPGTLSRVTQQWEAGYEHETHPGQDAWGTLELPHDFYKLPPDIAYSHLRLDGIYFRTSIAKFIVGENNEEIASLRHLAPTSLPIFNIRSKDNTWAGVVHMHDPNMHNSKFDFLVISEAQLVGLPSMDPTLRSEWDHFTFFNTLAVTWEGSLATRIGIGRISKDAWGKSEPKWADVALC